MPCYEFLCKDTQLDSSFPDNKVNLDDNTHTYLTSERVFHELSILNANAKIY